MRLLTSIFLAVLGPRITVLSQSSFSLTACNSGTRSFYWHSVHRRHNSQKDGERSQNAWANSITYDNRKQANRSPDDQLYIHGDGVLTYPREERLHPEEDLGVPGPIATLQLAIFRRGLHDHQYLTLARGIGLNAVVDEVLKAIVPRVFSDAGERVGWPETGTPTKPRV